MFIKITVIFSLKLPFWTEQLNKSHSNLLFLFSFFSSFTLFYAHLGDAFVGKILGFCPENCTRYQNLQFTYPKRDDEHSRSNVWCSLFCLSNMNVLMNFLSAAVLFIWGTLCLKLSHVHFSHSVFLKRLNVLVLCTSVLLEILQPDLNIYKVRVPFSLL